MYRSYLRAIRPQLRFLVIIRDPTDRVRSWFDHFRLSRNLTQPPIELWVPLSLGKLQSCARRHGLSLSTGALWNSACRDVAKGVLTGGLYAPQISSYLHYFEETQMALLSYVGYVKHTEHVLSHLQAFLGLRMDLGHRRKESAIAPTPPR